MGADCRVRACFGNDPHVAWAATDRPKKAVVAVDRAGHAGVVELFRICSVHICQRILRTTWRVCAR